jgi:hypothetical protein
MQDHKYDLQNEYQQNQLEFSDATEGNLTRLEKSLNKSNPKMQLLLESSKIKTKHLTTEVIFKKNEKYVIKK